LGSVFLFVSKQDYAKTTQPVFAKFGGKVKHGPAKKLLDFDGSGSEFGIFKIEFLTLHYWQ